MTVVNPKSISGINSITMASGSDNLLTIHANDTSEKVRVNSSGDVIVGSGVTLSPDGDAFFTGITTVGSHMAVGGVTPETFGGGHVTLEVAGSTTSQGGVFKTATSDSAGTGSSGTEMILFTDSAKGAINVVSSDPLTFSTANTERLRITSDGKMGLGIASPTGQFAVSDGTRIAEINPHSSGTFIGNRSNHDVLFQVNAATKAKIDTNGHLTISDGDLVIGTSGHGIDFSAQTATSVSGASATAEVLDHYEEGTWTPSYLNVTVSGYGHQSGTYTRIGRAVHCQFQISVDSGLDTSDGSAISIGGLPFSGNSSHESCVFSFGKLTSILSNTRLAEVTNFRFGGTFVQLHRGSDYDLNYTTCNSSGHLQGAFTYQMS